MPTTDAAPVLAIDIGGTKLAAALVDVSGRVLSSRRVATPRQVSAEALWATVVGLVDGVLGDVDPVGVGVGCGGPMDWPEGAVSPLNIPVWRGFPLRERLVERFPGRPVRVHNDAVCVAIGEHWRGAGQGLHDVLGMVVSTGVGGGLVLGDRVIDGSTGNAGHIGHVVVDPDGPSCMCGGRGCLEAIARGPALAAAARAHGWIPPSGEEGTARDLADDAERGHPIAIDTLRHGGEAIGIALASSAHLLDLDVVAIGGGVAQAGRWIFSPLEDAFRRHARMRFATRVRVVPTRLGQGSGLVGAAALVVGGDRYWSAD